MSDSWRDVAFARQERIIHLGPLTINILLRLFIPTETRHGLISLADPERWEHMIRLLWRGDIIFQSIHRVPVEYGSAVWLQRDTRSAWRAHRIHLKKWLKGKLPWHKSG